MTLEDLFKIAPFSLVKEEQEALLEGYLSGDGHYRDGGNVYGGSAADCNEI